METLIQDSTVSTRQWQRLYIVQTDIMNVKEMQYVLRKFHVMMTVYYECDTDMYEYDMYSCIQKFWSTAGV